jgi:hypothetical protein
VIRADPASEAARDSAAIWAGVAAGLAGLATFLVIHHVWIVPIWGIAPVGAMLAGLGGALVGAAYGEALPRLPRRPLAIPAVIAVITLILAPSLVIAQATGPMFAMTADGGGNLLVPPSSAILGFVVGLLGTATVMGAIVGWLVGRTRRAIVLMAGAGFVLALGPGHNIPFLGASSAVGKELVILAAVVVVASIVLVETNARLVPSADG